MISNIANLVVITAKCLEGQFFPDFALLPYRYSMSLFMVIVEIFILIPVFIFLKKVITPAISCSQSFHEWRYLWLIPATFYLIWYYMVYGNSTLSGLEIALNPKNIIVSVFVNAGALLIYSIVARLIVNQEQILKLQQQNHQLELQTVQYEKLQERIEDARRAKHDLHHHLSVMQAYLEKKDYESLASYLEQYCKQLPDHSLITFCENIDANIVLSHYAQEAERLAIFLFFLEICLKMQWMPVWLLRQLPEASLSGQFMKKVLFVLRSTILLMVKLCRIRMELSYPPSMPARD